MMFWRLRMTPVNILHIIPYFIRANKTGGPAVQLSGLAKALLTIGNSVTIVASTGNLDEEIDLTLEGNLIEVLEQGVPTIYLRRKNNPLPRSYYYAPGLASWLQSNLQHFEIVIIHGTWTYFSWKSARICQKAGKPYLFFVHGSFDPWALNHHGLKKLPYWHLIEKPNFKKASGVIVLSQDEADQVLAMGIEKPVFLARNGLLFPLARVADPFVYFMARLHPKKGLEVLLDAWSRLHNKHSDWRLVIAGPDEGGYLAKLREIAQQLGVGNSIVFPGLVTGDVKAAFFQRASLFVLTSFSEGVPGAVIEALGYSLPVLITPGCHLSEIAEAQAGLIVEPQAQAVANGLDRLIVDTALREQMGRNAEQLARSEFDEREVAAGLANFCKTIVGNYSEG